MFGRRDRQSLGYEGDFIKKKKQEYKKDNKGRNTIAPNRYTMSTDEPPPSLQTYEESHQAQVPVSGTDWHTPSHPIPSLLQIFKLLPYKRT